VTGANTGIGRETVLQLVNKNVRCVILACRSQQRAQEAILDVNRRKKPTSQTQLDFIRLDLTDLASVRQFVDAFRQRGLPLHVLINNAGVVSDLTKTPPIELNGQKIDPMWFANHLGHFLLTELLIDLLATPPGKVIIVSSEAHQKTYMNETVLPNEMSLQDFIQFDHYAPIRGTMMDFKRYSFSKLCNVWHTLHLHRRFHESTGITFNCLHPGAVSTELLRDVGPFLQTLLSPVMWAFFKTPSQGAETQVFLASDPSVEGSSGGYYDNCKPSKMSEFADDKKRQQELFELSSSLVEAYLNNTESRSSFPQ